MFNTIIFDLDGTLLDTLEDLADSVNATLAEFGFLQRSLEEVRAFVGNGAKLLIEQALPSGHSKEEFRDSYEYFKSHYFLNMQNKTRLYEGIKEMLDKMKERRYKMAVVSNKPDWAVKELCKHYFSDYLEVAIGDRDDVPKKPSPVSLMEAMRALSSKSEESLYVGDSEVDIQTARNAGISCVAVSWGFRPKELLENEKPQFIIDKPNEIFQFIR